MQVEWFRDLYIDYYFPVISHIMYNDKIDLKNITSHFQKILFDAIYTVTYSVDGQISTTKIKYNNSNHY